MRDRWARNEKDEMIIMNKLKLAGYVSSVGPEFTSDFFSKLDPNTLGGVDVPKMNSWLQNRVKHLGAFQRQVYSRIHPI